jgi:hypothetical protein
MVRSRVTFFLLVGCVLLSGFYINGVKYMKLNSELGSVIRGKQGENAAAAAFSKKAVIIGTGKGSPQEISNAVEKMAADLASKGF